MTTGTTRTTAGTAVVATTTTTTTAGTVAARTSLSVRARITATVAALTLVGLVVAGVVVFTIESQRLDQQITAETEQEFAELASLGESQSFASPEAMLRAFLQNNVPDDNELLVTWWGDGVRATSVGVLPLPRAELADVVRSLLADNGTTT